MFLCICRVIQIRDAFEARDEYSGKNKVLNRVGAVLSIIGFLFVFLSAAIDYGVAHSVVLVIVIIGLFCYIWITTALTMQERKSRHQSTGELYVVDTVLQGGLSILSTVCILIYIIYYIVECMSKGLSGADGCKVSGLGNVCEWLGFFGMSIVVSSFVITFQHDDAYAAIQDWWIRAFRDLSQCQCPRYRKFSSV